MPQSSEWSLSFQLSHQNLVDFSLLTHACYMPTHLILLGFMCQIILGMRTNYEAPHCATSYILPLLHPSLVQIFPLEPCSQTPLVYALPLMLETKFHTHTEQLAELWFLYTFNLYITRQQAEDKRWNWIFIPF
jgi:hypothetical protein